MKRIADLEEGDEIRIPAVIVRNEGNQGVQVLMFKDDGTYVRWNIVKSAMVEAVDTPPDRAFINSLHSAAVGLSEQP